jgi:hypothetical protein
MNDDALEVPRYRLRRSRAGPLADIQREYAWPSRSAKVVLQLSLDRLARHYGFVVEARGPARMRARTWLVDDAAFVVNGETSS